jgi:hypothetical protein
MKEPVARRPADGDPVRPERRSDASTDDCVQRTVRSATARRARVDLVASTERRAAHARRGVTQPQHEAPHAAAIVN